MNQGYPPARRRGKNSREQEIQHAPASVVIALIGQSRRRCVTITEMLEKQAMGLVQLEMECNQMTGLLRQDPQGLNRLAISLHAARINLKKNKEHLQEQIQVELFLQGEFQRWLNGEPPSDFAPPPPGMVRHQMPPNMMSPQLPMGEEREHDEDEHLFSRPPMQHPVHGPPPQGFAPPGAFQDRAPPPGFAPPHAPPQRMPPRESAPQRSSEPLFPPQAAFAAYGARGHERMIPTHEAAAAASHEADRMVARASAAAPQPTRMPVVRLPVEQFGAPPPPPNGPSAPSPMSLVKNDDEESDKSSSTPS